MTVQKSWQAENVGQQLGTIGKESQHQVTMLGDLNKKELRHLPLHPLPPPPPPLLGANQTVVGDSTLGAGQRTVGGGRQERVHILVGRRTLKFKFKSKF